MLPIGSYQHLLKYKIFVACFHKPKAPLLSCCQCLLQCDTATCSAQSLKLTAKALRWLCEGLSSVVTVLSERQLCKASIWPFMSEFSQLWCWTFLKMVIYHRNLGSLANLNQSVAKAMLSGVCSSELILQYAFQYLHTKAAIQGFFLAEMMREKGIIFFLLIREIMLSREHVFHQNSFNENMRTNECRMFKRGK